MVVLIVVSFLTFIYKCLLGPFASLQNSFERIVLLVKKNNFQLEKEIIFKLFEKL